MPFFQLVPTVAPPPDSSATSASLIACAWTLVAVAKASRAPARIADLMALELAQMADDSGLTTLAYLFRMAALEASTANNVVAGPDDLPHQMTSH